MSLNSIGRWESWLNADDEMVDRTMLLFMMPDVLDAKSATVASLIGPFQGRSANWRLRLQRLVERGSGYTSPEMEDLVIALMQDGTLDTANGFAVNSDWWSIWYMASTQKPAFTARVLGAWFDRQLERADELNRPDPFSGSPKLVTYSQFSEHVIKECATRAPREFVREMFPRFACLDRKVPKEWIAGPSAFGSPDEQLRDALVEAMMSFCQSRFLLSLTRSWTRRLLATPNGCTPSSFVLGALTLITIANASYATFWSVRTSV